MDLEKLYGQAGRELRAEFSAIDPLNFDGEKADVIRKKTRRLTLALNLAAKRWTDTELLKAYTLGTRRARVALEILGRKPRRQPMAKDMAIRDKALETLVEANTSIRRTVDEILQAALMGAHTARVAQVQEFDRDEILARFEELGEKALKAQISRGELGREIYDYLIGQIDELGFINVNGRYWDPRKYAKLVARTELRKAQTEATEELCRQYENDLVQVSDHATDCEVCEEYEGNIYSLSGKDQDYPKLEESPPYHPNCKHSILPTSREAIRARG